VRSESWHLSVGAIDCVHSLNKLQRRITDTCAEHVAAGCVHPENGADILFRLKRGKLFT